MFIDLRERERRGRERERERERDLHEESGDSNPQPFGVRDNAPTNKLIFGCFFLRILGHMTFKDGYL